MEENDRPVWVGAALFVAVIAAGVLIYRFAAAPPPAAPISSPTPAAPAAAPADAAIPLPKLEESDEFVRSRAAALSTDPTFAAWLKNGDLISRFVTAVNMIAGGKVPGDALKFLAPRGKFSVVRRGGKIFMDPRGYARYDAIASVIASVNSKLAATVFRELKPLLQQAWNSLGESGDVRDGFVKASTELISLHVPDEEVELKQCHKGLVYVRADLFAEYVLHPAQKQLLRMGPKNAKAIQNKLRDIVAELGKPYFEPEPIPDSFTGPPFTLEQVCHE